MKGRHRLPIAGLVVVALAALIVIATAGHDSLATDGVIYVDADATSGDNNGTSWEDAFTSLQPALYTAGTGSQIWVAEGTYKPTSGTDRTASFEMVNGVTINGGFAGTEGSVEERDWMAHPTILSGDLDGDDGEDFANNDENSYHVFFHPDGTNLDSTAILDGFTISGGNANDEWGTDASGGGMYNYGSSPALTNCTFSGNSASFGGGMYNADGSSPALTDCTFEGNSVLNAGGGMYNHDGSSPELNSCTLANNSAGSSGGGMINFGNCAPELTNCTFENNSADAGGGMSSYDSSPVLTECTFRSNSANGPGGGMSNMSSSPVLSNCSFDGNSSANWGGGMSNGQTSAPTLSNCSFHGNSANSWGGGMSNDYGSSPVVTNCILWGDTPQEIYNTDETSLPDVTYSDVQGGYEGEGNIDIYPFFADPVNGDFHLGACSRCIDAGNNEADNLPETDFEGDDRILDGDDDGMPIVDMGVDEVVDGLPCWHVYLPLVLRNY